MGKCRIYIYILSTVGFQFRVYCSKGYEKRARALGHGVLFTYSRATIRVTIGGSKGVRCRSLYNW